MMAVLSNLCWNIKGENLISAIDLKPRAMILRILDRLGKLFGVRREEILSF